MVSAFASSRAGSTTTLAPAARTYMQLAATHNNSSSVKINSLFRVPVLCLYDALISIRPLSLSFPASLHNYQAPALRVRQYHRPMKQSPQFEQSFRYSDHLLRLHLQLIPPEAILGHVKSSFISQPPSLVIVLTKQTTTTAAGCGVVTVNPIFITSKLRPWRASFYAGFGLFSIIFVFHGLYLHGWEMQNARMSLTYMLWMAVSNLTGAALYAARVRNLPTPSQLTD